MEFLYNFQTFHPFYLLKTTFYVFPNYTTWTLKVFSGVFKSVYKTFSKQ